MKSIFRTSGIAFLLGSLAVSATAATPGKGIMPATILSVIPSDCWAFVEINNLRNLDDTLANYFEQIDIPPLRLMALIQSRLNLGPQIDYDDSFAVVLMPAEDLAQLGSNALLMFPCSSVPSLLSEFPKEKIADNLWQAELVWGTTFVGQKGNFAVFGTTRQATERVLSNRKSIAAQITGPLMDSFSTNDLNIWIAMRNFAANEAIQNALFATPLNNDSQTIFGLDSILSWDAKLLKQIDSLHIGLDFNAARIKITAHLQPSKDSTLSALLAFAPPSEESLLALLPNESFIVAAAGLASEHQMKVTAAEIDKLFHSKTIESATDPQRLGRLRDLLRSLVGEIRGGAWALTTQSQSPEGLAAVVGALKVADASAWLAKIAESTDLLGSGLFIEESANKFYREITYQPQADTITGVPIHHLILDLVEHAPPADSTSLNYAAALGPARKVIQLAATDAQTVVFCAGDHPRIMAALISSARAQSSGLSAGDGVAKIKALLPGPRNITAFFMPEELLRLGRVLARMQNKVDTFPHQTLEVNLPIGVTITKQQAGCRVQVIIPTDLVKGFKSAYIQAKEDKTQFKSPPKASTEPSSN